MRSLPAKGGDRGRRQPWLLLACVALCASATAFAQTAPPSAAETPAASANQVDNSFQERVDSTTKQFGRNSLPAAEAYSDLADAARRAGQHDLATQNYLTAIEIYRAVDGAFSPLAIPLLVKMGDNYREARDGLNAVAVYSEARTVTRRVYGLLSEQQLPMIDKLSTTLLDLNRPVEAEAQQQEALRIAGRTWPPESAEGLAAVYRYAAWLQERGLFQLARDQYENARRIILEHYGKKDVRLVTPLLGLGNSFRAQRIPVVEGQGAIEEALQILVAQPTRDPLAVATALRDLGDWQVAFERTGSAGTEYRRAWQLLGEVANGDAVRREWFSGPTLVLREPIVQRGLSEDPKAPSGHVLVRFDLDRNGIPGNVTIVESDPAGLLDEAMSRHIKRSRFRPQMADGEIVSGEALRLRLTFQYETGAEAGNDDGSKEKKRSRRK